MSCAWKKYLSIFFVLMIGFPVFAQTFRGTVSGTVVDAQNAVIANADIQLTNPATGTTLRAKSSASGDFNFPELPVGTYELTVGASGFQTRKIAGIDIKLMEEALSAAEKIASMSQPAAAMAKQAINRAFETPLTEGLNVERDLFHATFALEDRSEGMAAFIEKRKPVNKNR